MLLQSVYVWAHEKCIVPQKYHGGALGTEYLVFVSSRSLKMREKYTKWGNLVCLSCFNLYIFLSFWGNERRQKPNIPHLRWSELKQAFETWKFKLFRRICWSTISQFCWMSEMFCSCCWIMLWNGVVWWLGSKYSCLSIILFEAWYQRYPKGTVYRLDIRP